MWLLTSNLGHLVLDLAQTEDVLGRENGAVVDQGVVNASDIARPQNETH